MFRFKYAIYYSLIWLITLPPMWMLYGISDFLYLLNFGIIKYRKKVIKQNLRKSFPEKSEKEIRVITKKYYRHMGDMLVETLKSVHFNKKQLNKRYKYINYEALNDLYDKGKNIVLVSGHYANWEWMMYIPQFLKHKSLVIYHPLKNKYFDKLINSQRSKGGLLPVPMNDVFRKVLEHKKNNELILTWFLADQRPPRQSKFWTTFLNQDTSFFLGAEKIAVKTDAAVVLVDAQKVKRGYYTARFEVLFDEVKNAKEFEITNTYISKLEDIIKNNPAYWLWSHKRWKHKKPENL